MDRVGIYWYRSLAMMQGARSQLMKGEARSVFGLQQLGLKVVWVAGLKLVRDPGTRNQMSLSTPTKIMKLRAASGEAMEAWISAFDKLRESLAAEFQASSGIQRELIRSSTQRGQGPHHQRSRSTSNSFLGQSMMVTGNTTIVRTRSASAMPLKAKPAVFGATFMIGVPEVQESPEEGQGSQAQPQPPEPSASFAERNSEKGLLEPGRPESSVSASYLPLEGGES